MAVCMGPESAQRPLQKALALGADRALLLTDPALAGSDISGTAYALATVLEKQNADLVILGQQAADADCYVMAAAVADHLHRPLVTQVAHLEVSGGKLRAKRQTEHGYDVIEAPLPAVISVSDAINTARLPSIKAIMGAKKKPTELISAADAGLDTSRVGSEGARSVVASTSPPPAKDAGKRIEDSGGDSAPRDRRLPGREGRDLRWRRSSCSSITTAARSRPTASARCARRPRWTARRSRSWPARAGRRLGGDARRARRRARAGRRRLGARGRPASADRGCARAACARRGAGAVRRRRGLGRRRRGAGGAAGRRHQLRDDRALAGRLRRDRPFARRWAIR